MSAMHARSGMVATSQRLATAVGVELLKQGGSAVDAALGANAMLSLIEPYMCGPGGDLFAMVWDPAERALQGLNASGRSPSGQTLSALKARIGDAEVIPTVGAHSITVPGAVRGWAALHERYGRLPLAAIYAPVIEHAARGVDIGTVTAQWWQYCAEAVAGDAALGARAPAFKRAFMPDQRPPRAGDRFFNVDLGNTYRRLAEEGYAAFYEGAMAAQLSDFLARSGSALTAADLTQARAEWIAPISTRYREHEVFELPPNGQGLAALQMLNMLECFPLASYGFDTPRYRHCLIEAKKLAFEDRARYYADPGFADVPIAALADKGYGAERARAIGERANAHPRHGDPAIARGDTTYLTVADADGMMVSLIQSIFTGFGSGLVPDGMGFSLQCRGAAFSLHEHHPNVYAPGKRPFHTIVPAFVMKDERPIMSFGVMGSDMQPQGQVQVLVNMLDFGMDVHAAGAAPRMRHDGLNSPTLPRESDGGIVWYEAACAPATLDELRKRGHDVRPASHPVLHFMGGYQAIRCTPDGYVAASEPRFDGCAAGY